MRVVCLLWLAFLSSHMPGTLWAQQSPRYHIVQRVTLGGEGGWDYLTLDAVARRLYVTRGSHVMVLDSESLKPVGDIPSTPGVHGVGIAANLHRGFASDGAENTVTVFDTNDLRVSSKVRVGDTPDAILYDNTSGRVFTFNARGHDATAIDAKTLKVVGSIPLGGKPEFAVADGEGHVFVNIENTAEIAMFDARKLTVMQRWKMPGCEEPTGLALDSTHKRLFAGCHNGKMMIVDSASGRVVASVPIGEGVDGTAFDPASRLAFSSNGVSGTLTVVHENSPEKFTVLDNVMTARGARTMVLDPASHKIYTATTGARGFELLVVAPQTGH